MAVPTRSLGFLSSARPSIGIRSPVGRTLQNLPAATRSNSSSSPSDSSSSPPPAPPTQSSSSSSPTTSTSPGVGINPPPKRSGSFEGVRRHVVLDRIENPSKWSQMHVLPPWQARANNPPPGPEKKYYRSVRINGITENTTLTDIINAIAHYGPFEKIASASMRPASHPAHREAVITFSRESGARQLVRFASIERFEINGVRPFVAQNMSNGFHQEVNKSLSRVLYFVGDPNLPNFNEEGMRKILVGHSALVGTIHKKSALYKWGFESMPATYTERWDGKKIMQWPFFDIEYQAKPFMLVLREYFKHDLLITMGHDPCERSPLKHPEAVLQRGQAEKGQAN
ncbi:hypothetical protein BD289DRAFT_456584 [Coniella lustricola]|uniref:RRM domain-containing protein n=1 Tax=Coniella lustricola TaxID=2025994 RepID=A0A2T2ZVB8_9PEZI|nr:hypothetical protein BD289DRAFT_456584 [Coniella lustricola]